MDQRFENYRSEMINLITSRYELNGAVQSEIPNLDFYFSKELTEQINIMYEPSLCVILQGDKAVGFGENNYGYDHKMYLLSSTHLPAKMKILKASNETPYISLRIKFTLENIYEVLKALDSQQTNLDENAEKGLFFDDMNIQLYESLYRFMKLLERSKKDIEFLYPLLTKEILYNLVKSQGGAFLSKFCMEGSVSNKIVQVITYIKDHFNEKLNINTLAKSIDMSESSLYQHFKTITTLSPIQFQKKLRLEEAKRLLQLQNKEISEVAFAVGYESPSQFSREFSRMFGLSPKAFANLRIEGV
ncbi:AraC family transcriptional regulator [Sulfurimonas marina]|uniref:AraC family transcriptional regulator n=1 Tax=Sulfurimonas marina TaxID=2590551 RepID=A0A7M1AVB5_9BACT|nr:AraC family transcriptional regulator [Sulfurimonas marina]QOP41401.1 AraC family transcriptional regulator [Sulfurimonas marina]